MRSLFLAIIKFYQYCISPLMGSHCRYYPTCSAYAFQAIQQHGAIRGSFLAIKRLSRCHPFSDGGLDPVPPPVERRCSCNHKDHSH
ncbi:MAG: membrane protein insertion efficiency factor YidD [Pseudomonadales bacterium]|uniref:membrane protein insertion efficiency factor YidD n=1 Tax=Oleiphilus messinensis TaxID=141451 RepID=UPI000B3B7A04|nr:membrane protein insertion efficiency factor YidD [Oleiphilus messinensis]MCG8609103.1 membrane protein insertion efficiency factor YidD [Pseudomonadales bacterium]